MKLNKQIPYACPRDKTALRLIASNIVNNEVLNGKLVSESGAEYPIRDGFPDFVIPTELKGGDAVALRDYDLHGKNYDQNLPITFQTIGEDELTNRKKIIGKLELKPGARVLDLGCGSGRDTLLIAELLDGSGELYAQDLSLEMLNICRDRMRANALHIEFARTNACALPFRDNYFDAVFHFGGLNTFTYLKEALAEMSRITREDGKVVVGDEAVAPWLRNELIGKILMHNMPLFASQAPVEQLPVSARNVCIEWVFGGFFYVIDFTVSKKEPQYNLDIPLPHGGTNRTRYFGQLEGVKVETKELARAAREAAGKNMHDWLDEVVREAARRQLDETK
jgi:ubiquinone/menaquinone biosynthesis C-methylase UbiE/uncharacterized protein YbaR (Trm112 family)